MKALRRFKRGFRAAAIAAAMGLVAGPASLTPAFAKQGGAPETSTPIEHLVVIFQENVSFDHYFGTYPNALNKPGEPPFTPSPGTPAVNGLTAALLTSNPNLFNPVRFGPDRAATCDQDHDYMPEQQAFDLFNMDQFPKWAGVGAPGCPDYTLGKNLVMAYYDGNTVTALWNYAQNFAMSDNSYGTTYGPSTPGALNLASGQTNGATSGVKYPATPDDTVDGSVISDPQPDGDVCTSRDSVSMKGKNVGDLLNAKHVTWGWFQGGFNLGTTNPNKSTGCARTHTSITGAFPPKVDYIPHHEPFQYYSQTANPNHLRPLSVNTIGFNDQANHQYDLDDFFTAAANGNLPAVSFVKAAGYQDGHAGYSSPLDEQTFMVDTINFLQKLHEWKSMAIVISYDDSDGWYDHQPSPLVNGSTTSFDALTGKNACGSGPFALLDSAQGRCGYGPRLPLIVISPFAKKNFVDHTLTDQTSILRFIEDNWNLGRIGNGSFDAIAGTLGNMFDFDHSDHSDGRVLILDPTTGEPI